MNEVLCVCVQDGCWGCFDDIETLNKEGVSVLVDHIQAVLGAVRARADYCLLGDGQEVGACLMND